VDACSGLYLLKQTRYIILNTAISLLNVYSAGCLHIIYILKHKQAYSSSITKEAKTEKYKCPTVDELIEYEKLTHLTQYREFNKLMQFMYTKYIT
jgi:hypothetical protein